MDRETNTNSIFVFIFSFVFGVLISSFIFVPPLRGLLVVFLGVAILVADRISKEKFEKAVLFLSIALLAFGLGLLRYSIKDFHEPLVPASQGVVVSEPEQKENTTRFILRSDNGEKVLVNTDLYSPVQYGDRVEVSGKLQEPGIIVGDDGRGFDYAKYLSKDEIYHTISFAKVSIISHSNGNLIKQTLLKIKTSFVSKTKEILAEPESSLLAGLIVSGKEAMPKDILEEFRRAGVIHIVVLSGYNITIIAEFMRVIFRSATFSIIGILFFVIMTGAQATVVRAALMVLAVILAKMFRRKFSAPRALLVAAFLMLVQNPKILVFDPSFQLSFLATSALIFVSPLFERHLKWVSEKWGLRTTLAATLATQIVVLPYLIYSMGNLSLVSIPANLLILLIIPYTMFAGFVAAFIAYTSSILALPFTYITHLLLAYILGVSHFLGTLSFASIQTPPVSLWIVVIIYILMILYLARAKFSSTFAQFRFWKKSST
ncbi:MAG: ComEC/Rec2 family competence protein [bacterium]|nr:ComEC/Rec2 family competence protein [bacterium]